MCIHCAIEIKKYWEAKVLKRQDNIKFKLDNLFVDELKSTGIAEWDVYFDCLEEGTRKHMKEIAVLKLENNKVAELREYWASETVSSPADG